MEENRFIRTEMILGKKAMARLAAAKIAVFGIGGVGGYVVEALARSGVGSLTLIDHDTISLSNINRQIIALESTVGQYKTEVMKRRILDINPGMEVEEKRCFFLPETAADFDFSSYSYVVDAVDTVTAKLEIIQRARACGVPVISCMGTGNKLDPAAFCIADIYETSVCPLAKVMRRELRKRGVDRLKVLYSKEEPAGLHDIPQEKDILAAEKKGKCVPGSVSFVPSVAGLMIAGEVIRDLTEEND